MSAFIVSDNITLQIAAASLINWQSSIRIIPNVNEVLKVANVLRRANYKGVREEYRHHDNIRFRQMFGELELIKTLPDSFKIEADNSQVMQIYKHCQCLDYQSFGLKNWERSKAYNIINHVRAELSQIIITELPEYDRLKWGE